jgi:hypothetical protein
MVAIDLKGRKPAADTAKDFCKNFLRRKNIVDLSIPAIYEIPVVKTFGTNLSFCVHPVRVLLYEVVTVIAF